MSLIRFGRITTLAAVLCVASPTASAQMPEPRDGYAFACDDGSKMVLSFAESGETGGGIMAVVWLRGESFRLPYLPPEPGPVQVAWSDGEHELTWNPGVRLMWMASDTHLMCGRGEHKH